MNIVFTLAVGDKIWSQFALNWILSVKNARPQAETLLIYEESAVEGNEELLDHYFDHTIQVPKNPFKTGAEYAFKLKTELYDLVKSYGDIFLFMDADTIMNPRASVDDWFEELKDVEFTMWCNDVYDFETKARQRDDYTFWCDPEDVIKYDGAINRFGGKMPQVNSSFIYFKNNKKSELIFSCAKSAYKTDGMDIVKYKGAIPDEFAFNVSFAHLQKLPHQIPYYPIFFAFASENHELPYIQEWKAFGFAGDGVVVPHILGYYNELAYHYRKLEGIENWQFGDTLRGANVEYLPIEPICRRTLYRRGELPNSDGGVFNPDSVITEDESFTIFRKEGEFDGRKYVGHTATPHINDDELHIVGHEGKRIEDFRLFMHDGELISNHTVCDISDTSNISSEICLSKIRFNQFSEWHYPKLPIETNKVEKNWMFIGGGNGMWCIYSLNPYRLFFKYNNEDEWRETKVQQPTLKWFHDKPICNSTNPILIGKHYLMFFHTKERGIYYHGAVLIDSKSMQITHYTRKPIQIKSFGHGIAPNLIYVSGSVYSKEDGFIRVLYGEGDESACYNDYDSEKFMEEMFRYPVDKPYAGLDVQPIMIYVPDTEKWANRFKEGKEHFESVGIKNIITVPAIYGEGFGIDGTHEYNLDNPNGHHKIGVANTALFLTMYMVYNIENNLPNSHFFFLEDDSRFEPDFMEKLSEQLEFVPEDFDWLFVGHCCAEGKEYKHIGGNVYEVIYRPERGDYPSQYPLCGHAYMVAKKALPKIIETQRNAYVNVDINLALNTFKYLKVYIISPSLCVQNNNPLPK